MTVREEDVCEKNETCPICPHNDNCVSLGYTPQQIDDYCEKVLNLCLVARTDGSLMFESVQIIRQLQAEKILAGLFGPPSKQ